MTITSYAANTVVCISEMDDIDELLDGIGYDSWIIAYEGASQYDAFL